MPDTLPAPDISQRAFAFVMTLYGLALALALALYAASFSAFIWPVVVAWMGFRA